MEIGIRVKDKHGLTHRPKNITKIIILQFYKARELRKVIKEILNIFRTRVYFVSL